MIMGMAERGRKGGETIEKVPLSGKYSLLLFSLSTKDAILNIFTGKVAKSAKCNRMVNSSVTFPNA
jgi:hypothetical protein